MRNSMLDAAAEVITALGALKLKPSSQVRGDGEGGLIISKRRMLTYCCQQNRGITAANGDTP